MAPMLELLNMRLREGVVLFPRDAFNEPTLSTKNVEIWHLLQMILMPPRRAGAPELLLNTAEFRVPE